MFGCCADGDLSGHQKQSSRQLGTRRAVRSNGALFRKRALGSHRCPGVATDYDQVGFKSDLREINSPQATHHVAVVEAQCGDPSSILRTSDVRIPNPSKPDTRGGEDVTQDLNLESGNGLDSLDNIQESKLQSSETP